MQQEKRDVSKKELIVLMIEGEFTNPNTEKKARVSKWNVHWNMTQMFLLFYPQEISLAFAGEETF